MLTYDRKEAWKHGKQEVFLLKENVEALLKMNWVDIEKEFKKLNEEEIKKIAFTLLEEEYEREYLKKYPALSDEEKENMIQSFLNGKVITRWNEGLGNPVMRYSKDENSILEFIRDLENMHPFEHFVIEE